MDKPCAYGATRDCLLTRCVFCSSCRVWTRLWLIFDILPQPSSGFLLPRESPRVSNSRWRTAKKQAQGWWKNFEGRLNPTFRIEASGWLCRSSLNRTRFPPLGPLIIIINISSQVPFLFLCLWRWLRQRLRGRPEAWRLNCSYFWLGLETSEDRALAFSGIRYACGK